MQTCSISDPCPTDVIASTCAYLDLEEDSGTYCVDPNQICEQTGCSAGRCLALATYPEQIYCAQ